MTRESTALDGDKPAHGAATAAAAASTSAGEATAGLAQLNPTSSAPTSNDVSPPTTLQIHASVDSSEFAQGLSDRVSWMAGNGLNNAKLQLNPPQLGPIELSISVQGDHAQVSMVTHSAVTRDALESSTPALKEMLGGQGFGQVSVDISQRSFQDRSAYTPPAYSQSSASTRSSAVASTGTVAAGSTPRSSLGVLDAYA